MGVTLKLVRWLVLWVAGQFSLGAWAQPACEQYELQLPRRGSQIAERQPELQWGGDASASYRVQVAVILPEGRILESVDTVVTGTRWRFKAPVSTLTTAVKVIVSRNCPTLSIQDLNSRGPYFFIQTADLCALKPQSVRQQGATLRWEAATPADRYVVQLFSVTQVPDGSVTTRRIEGYEVTGSSWSLPADVRTKMAQGAMAGQSWMATVQACCGSLISHPQATRLDSQP